MNMNVVATCLANTLRRCPIHVIAIADVKTLPFSVNDPTLRDMFYRDCISVAMMNDTTCLIGETSSMKYLQRSGRYSRTLFFLGAFSPIPDANDFRHPWLWLAPIDRRSKVCQLATKDLPVGKTVFCHVNGTGRVTSSENGTASILFNEPYNFAKECDQMPIPATYKYECGINRHIFGAGFTLYPSDLEQEYGIVKSALSGHVYLSLENT